MGENKSSQSPTGSESEASRRLSEAYRAWLATMKVALLVAILSGCQASPDRESWECVNLWAELAVPEYQAYVQHDKRLGPLNKAVRLGTAERVLEITRDQLRMQETTADLRQEVRR